MLKNINIGKKKIFKIAICIFIALIILVLGSLIYNFYQYARKTTEQYIKESTTAKAVFTKQNLQEAEKISKTLREIVENLRKHRLQNREAVIDIMKDILEQYPNVFGVNVIYEPNAFDGRDQEFKGREPYGQQGIFFPYVWRGENGFIAEYSYSNAEDSQWYVDYKKKPQEGWREPKTYVIGGKNTKVVSYFVPILDDNSRFIGMIALDYSIGFFDDLIRQRNGITSSIITTQGEMVSSSMPANIISSKSGAFAVIDAAGRKQETTMGYLKTKPKTLVVVSPIRLEGQANQWFFCTAVANDIIMSSFQEIIELLAGSAIIFTVVFTSLLISFIFLRQKQIDHLTGLYNRKYMDTELPHQLRKAFRDNKPFSIIMCDLDCFKNINDTYGHLVGDEILKDFSAKILMFIRGNVDWAVRYGGDEFLIVLPGVKLQEAYRIAERLLSSVRTAEIRYHDDVIKYSISCGVASGNPESNLDIEELIHSADNNLYEAKKLGRDRYY